MNTSVSCIAALNLELVPAEGDSVPTEAHLLLPGPFRANDGRPHDVPAWQLDAAIAAAVMERTGQKQGDTLIDYEHQSLHTESNGQPVPAAGWFGDLLWCDGKGLYATSIRWTARARSMIAAREYRYISAVFSYHPRSGEVLEIVSVALTNTPALDGLDALVAARKTNPKEIEMADEAKVAALTKESDDPKTEVDALIAELEELKRSVATLIEERDAAVAKLADVEAKAHDAALVKDKEEHAALLKAALSDGRLEPALKSWASTQPLAALKAYLEAASPAAMLNKQSGKHAPNTAALTREEAELCKKLGVSHEAYLKAKE